MFWGISCESGKKYSQIVDSSYHISMAALEPKDPVPANKQVSVMVEHKNIEYLLCTLEHNRVMQVILDLIFKKGDDVTFFLNGEGSVHLTGYLVADYDIEDDMMAQAEGISDAESVEEESDEQCGSKRLLTLDASEEEDSEDWTPLTDAKVKPKKLTKKMKPKANGKKAKDVEEESEEEDEDDDSDIEEIDSEDEDVILEDVPVPVGKRKKMMAQNSTDAKRPKKDVATPSKVKPLGVEVLKNNKPKKSDDVLIDDESDDSEVDESSESEEDAINSSIGRTPMPSRKQNKSKQLNAIQKVEATNVESAKKKKQENKLNDASMKKKKSENKVNSPKEKPYSKKLAGGVEIEDIRIGNGPIAKNGKFAHVLYVGRLTNNEVFDAVREGKKPFSFRLGKGEVIKGWDIGFEGMRVGGKRRIKVPPHAGYGHKQMGSIPANSTLLFTVELKAIS